MFYVYILRNPAGTLYKGQTKDLQKRLQQHNDPEGPFSYTRTKGPWTLIYNEEHSTRPKAMEREKFFKTGKGRDFLKNIIEKK